MPYTCADIDTYTTSGTEVQRHILITIGALRHNCGWSAHDNDRRMAAEDLVFAGLLKLREACMRGGIDDLTHYVATVLRNDVIKYCVAAKRQVAFDGPVADQYDGGSTAIGMDALEKMIACARARLTSEMDRALFDLYVDGKPNRAMREVDPRSDRQITRLRTHFAGLLKECSKKLNR